MTAPKTLDTPYAPPRIFGPRYRTATLGILLVVTLIAFEGMSIGAVMPDVSKDLDALDLYGMSFSAFLIAGLFANVAAGLWSDRRGHAVPFLLGVALFVTGMVMAGAAGSKEVFIAARAVQGLGGGAVIVAIYVMIVRVYPPEARPRVFAGLSSAWVLPALVGPGLGGLIADTVGWRWVFYGIVPLVVPALVMLLPALRGGDGDTPEPGTGPRSRPLRMTLAALATAAGGGTLLYGVERLDTAPLPGGAATAAGLVLLAAGLPRLLPPKALRFGRGLPTTVMMRGVLASAFFGVNAFIPLVLKEEFGFSTTQAGVALTIGALGWSGGSYLQTRREFDRPTLVRLGATAVTAGILLTALALLPGMTGWIMAPAWMVAGFGMGIGTTSVSITTMRQSPDDEQGANSAALQVVDTLGGALTIGFGGVLVNLIGHDDIATGYTAIIAMTAAIGVLGTAVAGRMRDLP
ncbi:MFS transporter [Planomonospora parontospora subsp. parontospora]|uniref:MFS transporter n=2 Tax=Planomonospora parontospora TaxID=58119 RepID=A0AA37BI50_9ACTN|nr:MFS transporter [Planomonospora parontospora]GGK74263.1 MFS transporter [Planomonospora parontospora]GII09593.1 MFS transporter [Planomonospora parontospora subsp. parontospora]